MNQLINFDEKFQEYLEDNLDLSSLDNLSDDEKFEQGYLMSNELYDNFLQEPATWLNGETPQNYFDNMEASELLNLFVEYGNSEVPMPDLLTLAIENNKEYLEDDVFEILKDESYNQNIRVLCIMILESMNSVKFVDYLFKLQMNRKPTDELADRAFDTLLCMDKKIIKPLANEYFDECNTSGKDTLLEILAKPKCSENVFNYVLQCLLNNSSKREIYAKYLGDINNKKALPVLTQVALDTYSDYVSYMEIRVTIEKLGGKCPKRDFKNDPYFKQLHSEVTND